MDTTAQNNTWSLSDTEFDYSYVSTPARVACYDSFKSAPRITEISPAPTNEFIEELTTTIYNQSHAAGGKLPYTVIREVSENFIHAQFTEIIVSILDEGNTIRFADQGPGISQKEKAKLPGFSSAVEPMKKYIRGVGSGFPIVKDYLDSSQGTITIEDNLTTGAVITLSLSQKSTSEASREEARIPIPALHEREILIIKAIASEGPLGVTDLSKYLDVAGSTIHNTFVKLEEANILEIKTGKKRGLTEYGEKIARRL